MSEEAKPKTNSKYDTQPAGLEKWLDETVNKKSPLQLPPNVKKWLADNAWWIVLVGAVLSLWGAWSFWQLGHTISGWARIADDYARMYGNTSYSSQNLGLMWYLALAAMLVQGVLLLMAFTPLKERNKKGWNLLFYSSLVSVVMGVLYVLVPGYGIGSLFGTLLGAAIGWFFLFQVRSHFVK